MTDRVCLTCKHWDVRGVPRELFRICLAFCVISNTKAITLAHWRTCGVWASAAESSVAERVEWLKRSGVAPRLGSFPYTPDAGHSPRELGLFHDAALGVK